MLGNWHTMNVTKWSRIREGFFLKSTKVRTQITTFRFDWPIRTVRLCPSSIKSFILAFKTWTFRSDMKENVAKSYIGVLHFMKFFQLDATSVDEFFLAKFQSQIQHLVVPSEREWYSLERCRRLVSYPRLLRTSTSSPPWIVESLVPVLIVAAVFLNFIHGLRGW